MKYDTLESLGTAICDAIREKEKSSNLIDIQGVPERIKSLSNETGTAPALDFLGISSFNLTKNKRIVKSKSNGFNTPIKYNNTIPKNQSYTYNRVSNFVTFTQQV